MPVRKLHDDVDFPIAVILGMIQRRTERFRIDVPIPFAQGLEQKAKVPKSPSRPAGVALSKEHCKERS